VITEKEMDNAEKNMKAYCDEWKKRKRACMDIVDLISESVEQGRKEFIQGVGLETDEDYGVNLMEITR